jgi:hypothetical protein
MNDAICRRYPGAFKHPLDAELVNLPWWLKEAIFTLCMAERE